MVNLLRISLISALLCSCSSIKVTAENKANNVQYNYEELYLDKIKVDSNVDNDIIIDKQNWKTIKSNLIKIHYHILKLQDQIDKQKNK